MKGEKSEVNVFKFWCNLVQAYCLPKPPTGPIHLKTKMG